MTKTYTSILADAIHGFVSEMEALGYQYKKQASSLKRFDKFCAEIGHSEPCLSRELAMKWAEKKPFESDDARNRRIRLVRMLAKHMVKLGYKAYIYPKHLGLSRSDIYYPYIFSKEEIGGFLARVDRCLPVRSSPHRHFILPLLFRMLYGCGLRISEALNLPVCDVNVEEGILTIRNSKFRKDRLIPMSPSLAERCRIYMKTIHPYRQAGDVFLCAPDGGKYCARTIYAYFRRFLWEAGISHGGRGKGPRLHDFRHSFAVHCLKRWVRSAVDLTVALPYLSAYLGHDGLKGTQRYLRLTSELYPDIIAVMDEKFGHLLSGGDR
jgi:integrase